MEYAFGGIGLIALSTYIILPRPRKEKEVK